MKTSKYAPRTPAESLAQSKSQKLSKDKERATRLLGRLRWKAELLMVSYYRTMEIVQAELQKSTHHEVHHSMESGATANMVQKQAESMFKVDFFEWYTLLERYVTDCLAVFGFSVSASAPRNNVNALRYITNPDAMRPLASHAFHANLLEALDDEQCPLHDSLGAQGVRIQLGLAKDYRNAWKGADEKVLSSNAADDENSRKNIPLQDLQLELMLRTLVLGCEQAHSVVQAYSTAVNGNNLTSRDFQPQTHGYTTMDTDDQPFEYMDDAMDLD
ncbi:hypothetical protein T440DRAFT_389138 [Plenodomus tracheiphilus IPT5]|uniref:Uncharacterized protein n=1 Tax=Plenodomus tracheiphilus IPT5 TaxID=1408161 RepID=A0A6A7BG76_9PLEO|nr:hypothetical protein T440DRAFT_389138 [Plenodomus tracheiphilus IPT5]